MKIVLSWEQRLIAERVIAGQRASISDMRAWQKLIWLIGFDESPEERNAATEAALLRIGGATEASFEPQVFNPQEFETGDSEIERLVRALKAWTQYMTADYRTYLSLVEALGKPDVTPKIYPAGFELEVNLLQRLQLLLYLKQQTGSPETVRKHYQLARKFVLDRGQAEAIQYRAFPNGACQWNRSLVAAYGDRSMVMLTDTELADLTLMLSSHEGWAPADVVWLDPVLAALEEPVARRDSLR